MALYAVIAILLLNRRLIFGSAGEGRSFIQRALLLAAVVGLLCLLLVPETSVVLSAVDAVGAIGLDVVTVLMLLELQRYLDGVINLLGGTSALRMTTRRAFLLCSDVSRIIRYTATGAVAISWLAICTSIALCFFGKHAP